MTEILPISKKIRTPNIPAATERLEIKTCLRDALHPAHDASHANPGKVIECKADDGDA